MIAIVAVDQNWAIGNKGNLLISLPEDQKGVFRKYTSGHTVVFGRKTLKTFRDERFLPNRINIVLSRNKDFIKEGAIVLHSAQELSSYCISHKNGKVFIIGGAEIYSSFINYCDEAIVTYIKDSFEADAYFENLDESPNWVLEYEEPEVMSEKGVAFVVRHYKNNSIVQSAQKL